MADKANVLPAVKPLAAALVSALSTNGNTVDPNVRTAKAPKGKREVQTPEAKIEEAHSIYFNPAQALAVESFYAEARDAEAAHDSMRRSMVLRLHAQFPRGMTYNQWSAFGKGAKAESEYVYKSAVLAIKLHRKHGCKYSPSGEVVELGKLPAADGGKKSGKRSLSPTIWHRSLARELGKIRERMGTCPRRDIDADVLRTFNAALDAVFKAEKALAKRIAA